MRIEESILPCMNSQVCLFGVDGLALRGAIGSWVTGARNLEKLAIEYIIVFTVCLRTSVSSPLCKLSRFGSLVQYGAYFACDQVWNTSLDLALNIEWGFIVQ
jgi:hypothetical protein